MNKDTYTHKIELLLKNNVYFAQIKTACLSKKLLNTYIQYIKSQELDYIHVKCNQINKILEKTGYTGTPITKDDSSILIFSKEESKLFNFLKRYSVLNLKYYNHNEKSLINYTLPKGPLGLKLDKKTPLDLLETYCNIKIVKGMLELLEPFEVLQKSKPIDKGICEILKTLRLRLKVSETVLLCSGKLDPTKKIFTKYSSFYNALKTNKPVQTLDKAVSLINCSERLVYDFKSRLLFRHTARKRAIKIIREGLSLIKQNK